MDLLDLLQLTDDDGEYVQGELKVHSTRLTDKKSTVVHLYAYLNEDMDFTADGSSHRVKGDVYDPDLGDLIATVRAMDKLLDKMKREMRRRMKAADDGQQV